LKCFFFHLEKRTGTGLFLCFAIRVCFFPDVCDA
jgi:hypothetical protein